MSQITKKVDFAVPVTQRSQVFTQADAGAGDILLIEKSLGKTAKTIQIQAIAAMTVSFNVLQTIFPPRDQGLGGYPNGHLGPNTAAGVDVEITNAGVVSLSTGETFSLDDDFNVKDIKLVSVAGDFEIFVA